MIAVLHVLGLCRCTETEGWAQCRPTAKNLCSQFGTDFRIY